MFAESASSVEIVSCSAADRARALELLLADLPAAERPVIAARLRDEADHAGEGLAGLFVARRNGQLVGTCYARPHPGRSGVVWPVRLLAGEPEVVADRLLTAACQHLARRQVSFVQVVLSVKASAGADHECPNRGDDDRALLCRTGFEHLADLLYLVCDAAHFPTEAPGDGLRFEPFAAGNERRMADLVEATYEGTLDCPRLNGVRSIDDVLAGHRATGSFDPQRWLFVRHDGRDVGCLLMADHPASRQFELVYMGLLPAARGNRWGRQVARYAQWLARCSQRDQLVLAVDAANRPAISMYQSVAFTTWDRRSVYWKQLS